MFRARSSMAREVDPIAALSGAFRSSQRLRERFTQERWHSPFAGTCPHDCPCEPPKKRLAGQRQPNQLIRDLSQGEGFARNIDDSREADFRLANRRLQPLGHLTARLQVYVTLKGMKTRQGDGSQTIRYRRRDSSSKE